MPANPVGRPAVPPPSVTRLMVGGDSRDDAAHVVPWAFSEASARGVALAGSTLYSTLEPCAFHGRTPSCARVIVEHRVARVITAMRDPHPRVKDDRALADLAGDDRVHVELGDLGNVFDHPRDSQE